MAEAEQDTRAADYKAFEAAGFGAKAASYDHFFGKLTAQVVEP